MGRRKRSKKQPQLNGNNDGGVSEEACNQECCSTRQHGMSLDADSAYCDIYYDPLWSFYEEAANQPSTEEPLNNPGCVAPDLFKALSDYKTDRKVIKELSTAVESCGETQILWFAKMCEIWSALPPVTNDHATKLVWDAMADVHGGTVPAADIMAFLSHYNLPGLMDIDGEKFWGWVPKDYSSGDLRVPNDSSSGEDEYEECCTTQQSGISLDADSAYCDIYYDPLWSFYEEAANQPSTEEPLNNPVCVAPDLFKALSDYKTDRKVIKELSTAVESCGETQILWFAKMCEIWSALPPVTNDHATKLVWDAMADVHGGTVPAADIMAFLSHYNLPGLMDIDGEKFWGWVPKDSSSDDLSVPKDSSSGEDEYEECCTSQQPFS